MICWAVTFFDDSYEGPASNSPWSVIIMVSATDRDVDTLVVVFGVSLCISSSGIVLQDNPVPALQASFFRLQIVKSPASRG